jgi:hypothetical protein
MSMLHISSQDVTLLSAVVDLAHQINVSPFALFHAPPYTEPSFSMSVIQMIQQGMHKMHFNQDGTLLATLDAHFALDAHYDWGRPTLTIHSEGGMSLLHPVVQAYEEHPYGIHVREAFLSQDPAFLDVADYGRFA